MTITISLGPELEAGLFAQAQANGKTVEQYVLSMVEGAVSPGIGRALSPLERAEAFEKWSASHPATPTPPLSEYAVSRESMYDDRDA
jgi:hypothetical protein